MGVSTAVLLLLLSTSAFATENANPTNCDQHNYTNILEEIQYLKTHTLKRLENLDQKTEWCLSAKGEVVDAKNMLKLMKTIQKTADDTGNVVGLIPTVQREMSNIGSKLIAIQNMQGDNEQVNVVLDAVHRMQRDIDNLRNVVGNIQDDLVFIKDNLHSRGPGHHRGPHHGRRGKGRH